MNIGGSSKRGGRPYNFKSCYIKYEHMEKQEMQVEWNLKHKVEMEKGMLWSTLIYSWD